MAQCGNQPAEIGDYSVIEQIGSGSFSVVWHAKHRFKGYDVAIKEIATGRLNKKLQESLLSEIEILRKIDHPNITRLHETVETPGRIYLVLEYCTGGDLSTYIHRHGRVSEATARHFMRQLAAGLRVLRENNLIHRDLKPQNLLLSMSDSNAVLKIADFGFARPLQPQGLAETLCGSPLYMAPEIMQFQKYDAKADLWSVGTILFQLVTGKTPFSGNNQMQLMQNILKSNELQFPPEVGELHPYCKDLCHKLLRQHPVERLSFEEFFDHEFLRLEKWESSPKLIRPADSLGKESSISGGNPLSDTGGSSVEDLPFPLDDDLHGQVGSLFLSSKENAIAVSNSSGFMCGTVVAGRIPSMNSPMGRKLCAGNIEVDLKQQVTIPIHKHQKTVNSDLLNALVPDVEHGFLNTPVSKELDSFEYIDQEYVFVPATSAELSSSSFSASGLGKLPAKVVSFPMKNIPKSPSISAPMAIDRAAVDFVGSFESPGNRSSIRSGTSPSSADLVDITDQPSVNPLTRLQSLIRCARATTELANEKLKAEKQLEAFSTQLVCLAIWKQALHICYDWAASATGGSPSSDVIVGDEALNSSANIAHMSEEVDFQGAAAACSMMEYEFLTAVEHAEKHAPSDVNAEMPDAMEAIFQEALVLGRKGAVAELMGNMKDAASLYSKSATLLYFLLVEAKSLGLNPPFLLSSSDGHRLRRYIDMLTLRQNQCNAETMALQHPEGLQSV